MSTTKTDSTLSGSEVRRIVGTVNKAKKEMKTTRAKREMASAAAHTARAAYFAKRREAISLLDGGGLTGADIARILEIPPSVVSSEKAQITVTQ